MLLLLLLLLVVNAVTVAVVAIRVTITIVATISVVFIFSIAVLDGQHEIGQVIACGLVAGSSLLCFVKLLIYENDKK